MDKEQEAPQFKSKQALRREIKKMLKEHKLEYSTPQVVSKLSATAENMAIELLKNATFYSQKTDGQELSKEDIQMAIQLRDMQEQKDPDGNVAMNAAAAINSRPLPAKDALGIALPKDNLGNCNYQLQNPGKKAKLEQQQRSEEGYAELSGPHFKFVMPYKGNKEIGKANLSKVLKNAMQGRDSTSVPMKITITPSFATLTPQLPAPGTSMPKKN